MSPAAPAAVSKLAQCRELAAYARIMPPPNPIARIEAVARGLGQLAEEIGDYAGPDARTVLLHWRRELLEAVDDVQRMGASARNP